MGTSKRPSEYNTRGAALDDAMALLMTIQEMIEQVSEHSMSISGKTTEGGEAIERGNVRLAALVFEDVNQASEYQRELLARMQKEAEKIRTALMAARASK